MFAYADDLLRDDVPVRQGRHHRLLPVCQDTRGESVLSHEIFPIERSRSRCRSPTHLHDGEFTIGGASRSIVTAIHRHLRNGGDVSGRRNRDLDAIRAQCLAAFDAPVHVVAEDQRAVERAIHIRPAAIIVGEELLEIALELLVFMQDRHQAEKQTGARAVGRTDCIRLQCVSSVFYLSGIEFAGHRIEHDTVSLIRRVVLADAEGTALVSNGTESLRALALLRGTDQLHKGQQRPQRRRMQRGLLSSAGDVILRKAVILRTGVLRIIKWCRELEPEGPAFKQFRF